MEDVQSEFEKAQVNLTIPRLVAHDDYAEVHVYNYYNYK